MKAIETKFIAPTDHKGARIRATDGCGNTVILPYPYDIDSGNAHCFAAKSLCEKMKWEGELVTGFYRDRGYHCFTNSWYKTKA